MKNLKNIFIILLLIYATVISAIFFGNNMPKKDSKVKVTKHKTLPLISSKKIKSVPSANWSTFEEFYIDIDNDGQKDCIKLQVDAEKDKSGNFEWNDGQKWSLNVYTKKGIYSLYQNFLQLGQYHMIVGTAPNDYSENPRIKIGLVNINHCGISLKSFTYSKKFNSFIKNYDSPSIDMNEILFSKI